jgi:hypothetical protein
VAHARKLALGRRGGDDQVLDPGGHAVEDLLLLGCCDPLVGDRLVEAGLDRRGQRLLEAGRRLALGLGDVGERLAGPKLLAQLGVGQAQVRGGGADPGVDDAMSAEVRAPEVCAAGACAAGAGSRTERKRGRCARLLDPLLERVGLSLGDAALLDGGGELVESRTLQRRVELGRRDVQPVGDV